MRFRWLVFLSVLAAPLGCGAIGGPAVEVEAGTRDAGGSGDRGAFDDGAPDASSADADRTGLDARATDDAAVQADAEATPDATAATDAHDTTDAAPSDAVVSRDAAGPDAAAPDAAAPDAGAPDAAAPDAGAMDGGPLQTGGSVRVRWQPTRRSNGGSFSIAGLNRPITGRATIDSTPGRERFVDEYGDELPLIGVGLSFNVIMAMTQANATEQAELMASQGINVVRVMHWDTMEPGKEYQSATGRRCGWWRSFRGWGPGVQGILDQIDPVALDRMNFFLWQLKLAGIRVTFGFDNLFVASEGRGRPPGGTGAAGGTPYPWGGQWWQTPLKQDIEDYLTALWSITNPYTGLRYAEDPMFLGVYLFNEQSITKAWRAGDAAGAYGLDRNFATSSAYVAEMDSDYLAWYQARFHEAPYRQRPGDGWVRFPSRHYDDTAGGQRPLYFTMAEIPRRRFAQYLLEKQRQIGADLKAHLSVVAPGLLVSGSTNHFGMLLAETPMDFQDAHFYANIPASEDSVDPQVAPISAARVESNALIVTLGSGFARGAPVVGKYVSFSGFAPANGFDPNGDWITSAVRSPTELVVSVRAPDQTLGAVGAQAINAARPGDPHGDSWLSNQNLGSYFQYGGGKHLAGKPLVIGELATRGMADRDTEHYLTTAVLCLLQGWSGAIDFSWGSGTAYLTLNTINGDEDAMAHPARRLSRMISALMLRHRVISPTSAAPVVADVRESDFIARVATASLAASVGWYPEFSGQWAAMYNDAGRRLRQRVVEGTPTTIPATVPATEPYTFGGSQVRWVQRSHAPSGGGDALAGRLELTDASLGARISGVTGLIGNGTYGRLTVSGLDPAGFYGSIVWISRDGSPLASGESFLFVFGPALNAGFQWLDADHSMYRSYAIGGAPEITVPRATITLDTGPLSRIVRAIAPDGTPSSVPVTRSGNTVRFTTGTSPWLSVTPP